MPPQFRRPPAQVLVPPNQIVEVNRHKSSIRESDDPTLRDTDERSDDRAFDALHPTRRPVEATRQRPCLTVTQRQRR